ncbi:MAG: 3-phosphoshikimate 1-carboxyvinyltransferase [Omnitrophica bacterium GWA2_52_12]|nr:MAG: 3-phosphoshikimate 1-carboxyvinyltransferase [Omnitrophica bacterium GWA2_52_12]
MTRTLSLNQRGVLSGDFTPPGDKSISHRAVMLGALAEGDSEFTHFLDAEDCMHTLAAFQAMGVQALYTPDQKRVNIRGAGLHGLKKPAQELYLGNSGTSMRLLLGILSGQRFDCTLTGDASLTSRPMKRVTGPLKQMGAQIKGKDSANFAPLSIHGGKLKGIDFENHLASAQVKSAILLAGLYADGITRVREPRPSRDHTEKMFEAAGADFFKENGWLCVRKTAALKPLAFKIPGDISAAAFFVAGAAMLPGSRVRICHVGLNPLRTGILGVLERMGASIKVEIETAIPEPMGTILIEGKRLRGTRITGAEIPSLIDELPILMTVMALSEGESLISGAEELRVKETDRIMSMVTNLNAAGGELKELPDGCVIRGVPGFHGAEVQSFGDHRTAMSMAIASLAADGEIVIHDTDCIATSFPGFQGAFESLRRSAF